MSQFLGMGGVDWAVMGAALAATLGGIGSVIGITSASSSAAGIVTEEPQKFGRLLPLAAMPGTQGIYGFIAAVLVIFRFGLFGGTADLAGPAGFKVFLACTPVAFACLFSAIYQGITASAASGMVARRAEESARALIFPALVETYAVISLIVTILLLLTIPV